MSLTCSLSGRIPFDPVVARPCGYLFDKQALEEKLKETGDRCPITGCEIEALLPVKTDHAQTLRTIPAANLPGLLTIMQGTYEELLQASFSQKRDLDQSKEQLAHVLTQHDAATRTIKRILGERDLARETVKSLEDALKNQRRNLSSIVGAEPTVAAAFSQPLPEEIGFSDAWKERVAEHDTAFSKKRKEGAYKEVHKTLTPFATNKEMQKLFSFSDRHQSTAPGISVCALNPADNNEVLTGGVDGNLEKFNLQQARDTQKPETLKIAAHEAAITCCGFHPAKSSILVSAAEDSVVKIWGKDANGRYGEHFASSARLHDGAAIADVLVHPLNDLMIAAGGRAISYFDMHTGQLLRWIKGLDEVVAQFKVHPNGKAGIAAVGRQIQLWDIAQGTYTRSMATKDDGSCDAHQAPITSVAVSHNALNIVTGSADGVVQLWDLRKQEHSVQTHNFSGAINKLRFDPAGQYLGVAHGEGDLDIYHFESKTSLGSIVGFQQAHASTCTDILFADRAKFAVSVGMDRCVNFYQAPELAGYFEEPDAKRQRV